MIIRVTTRRGASTFYVKVDNSKELFNVLVMNEILDNSAESLALSSYWFKQLNNSELVFSFGSLIEKINNPKFEELYK